jgi:exodeoxyribonuclease V gamma subunit
MPLSVSYIRRFEDVLEPAREFLSRDDDLFAKPRIVVPTAGAKAWLCSELAKTLGASRGDGIVANVEISYPGTILALLQPPRVREPDPWEFDRLTFSVLDVITGPERAALGIPFDVAREPLLAARRIAGLFDEYHIRRPGMIARWEAGFPHLSPVATNARSKDGEWAADPLADTDAWQFRTWSAVRSRIGKPSPPARLRLDDSASRSPLLIAGLQSLSLSQITALRTLGASFDVHALLVHPSPALQQRWAATTLPLSLDVPPPRTPAELPEDLDPLVATWLQGARETQVLLASQGIAPEHDAAPAADAAAGDRAPLLARIQSSIATAAPPTQQPHDLATDPSVTVHRCHTLARQAEVLHDALLHAFRDLKGLQPHEVVIMSPCLERLAPHLEAVFGREITGGDGRQVKLPLVVADRGLHEVSDAARLLVDVLRLVGSRCSVEEFRSVATHPLVQKHFGVDDDMIRCWDRLVERTKIHWGFDAAHRVRERFPQEATEPYTWRAGLERMLLGAVLPSAVGVAAAATEPVGAGAPAVAATIPLDDVPLGSLQAIETLVRIFEVVRTLDDACQGETTSLSTAQQSVAERPTAAWCDAVEEALVGLCGPDAGDLAEPLRAVRRLREAASATQVPFHDVRTLLEELLTSAVGRQPLRTGAITATSMVPLRDVPFRVVCIAGYDDRAVTISESQGDDLVSRQPLAGDGDPRIDTRRALLDCALAAHDRLIVTCTGMDIRNNKPLPLVTPLAELVDFAIRHGVQAATGEHPSGIEIRHPRHAVGRRNFLPGAVLPGRTWSHDAAACAASQALGGDAPPRTTFAGTPPELPSIELSMLEDMVRDPLKLYLRKSLGIDTWRDDDAFPTATFPLVLSKWDAEALAKDLLDQLVANPADQAECVRRWTADMRATGRVPFGRFGDAAIESARQLATMLRAEVAAAKPPIPLQGFESLTVNIRLPNRLLTGTIPIYHRGTRQLVDVRVSEGDRTAPGMPLHVAALRLLVAQAAATADRPAPEQAIVVARHEDWEVDGDHKAMIARTVTLDGPLSSPGAALARLAEICDLLPLALASPCGRFKTAAATAVKDLERGRVAFDRVVGEQGFSKSREAVVYGVSPKFHDVFRPDSPELAFHTAFERLFNLSRSYELS